MAGTKKLQRGVRSWEVMLVFSFLPASIWERCLLMVSYIGSLAVTKASDHLREMSA